MELWYEMKACLSTTDDNIDIEYQNNVRELSGRRIGIYTRNINDPVLLFKNRRKCENATIEQQLYMTGSLDQQKTVEKFGPSKCWRKGSLPNGWFGDDSNYSYVVMSGEYIRQYYKGMLVNVIGVPDFDMTVGYDLCVLHIGNMDAHVGVKTEHVFDGCYIVGGYNEKDSDI